MLEFIDDPDLRQAYFYLMSGSPPILLKLVFANLAVLAVFIVLRIRSRNPAGKPTMAWPVIIIGMNCLILFQEDVERYVTALMRGA